jgi:hypothetical protein
MAALFVPIGVGLPLLFWRLRLIVDLDSRNLSISYFPFVRRTIPLETITRWEVRTYEPIREYGGWGVRLSFRGRGTAYNVSGNEGVQLYLTDGSQLLIGSHRAEELARALEQAR